MGAEQAAFEPEAAKPNARVAKFNAELRLTQEEACMGEEQVKIEVEKRIKAASATAARSVPATKLGLAWPRRQDRCGVHRWRLLASTFCSSQCCLAHAHAPTPHAKSPQRA